MDNYSRVNSGHYQSRQNALVTIGLLVRVLNRQLECSGASMFLTSRKFFRDSATLILTLMELRLDLEFITKNVDNELKWISQVKANKKLWGVKDQINAVGKDDSEKSSDTNVYPFLSIIKHGNPAHDTWHSKYPLSRTEY